MRSSRKGQGRDWLPSNRPAKGDLKIEWGRVSGGYEVRQADLIRPRQLQNCPCRRRIQHRQDGVHLYTASEKSRQRCNGGYSPSIHPATQLSLVLSVSYASQAADTSSVTRVSVCERVCVQAL
uniref:Uncharacterized protein n=1 Tax=Rousettus aegyptiacus TaxID=9407 RepID=A0A7J8HR17_ROUAE|nr:hypothetical protein HJG63_010912 [Rousettus aegyptiacus]